MSEALWTMDELVSASGGTLEGGPGGPLTGVSIDSRSIEPGEIYVAIKGDVHDGHKFAGAALEAGAGVAIVSRPDDSMRGKGPLLVVKDDPLNAMERIGRAARERSGAKIAAITGSVGKTGSKEMLRLALARSGSVHASVKSFNNHWGVPLTLARFPREMDFGVFEVGMNHPGEIAPLARMARPHVAMITTVAAAHLEAFENIEGIADEKAAIFEGLEPGGTAIINADLPTTPILLEKARSLGAKIVTFGEASHDYTLTRVSLSDDKTVVQAQVGDTGVIFKINSAGRHFAMNGLGALAVADALAELDHVDGLAVDRITVQPHASVDANRIDEVVHAVDRTQQR